jgi:hypothetical protein
MMGTLAFAAWVMTFTVGIPHTLPGQQTAGQPSDGTLAERFARAKREWEAAREKLLRDEGDLARTSDGFFKLAQKEVALKKALVAPLLALIDIGEKP